MTEKLPGVGGVEYWVEVIIRVCGLALQQATRRFGADDYDRAAEADAVRGPKFGQVSRGLFLSDKSPNRPYKKYPQHRTLLVL